jgi:hypothetical protein
MLYTTILFTFAHPEPQSLSEIIKKIKKKLLYFYTTDIITNCSYLTLAIMEIGWRLGIILTGKTVLAWVTDYLKPVSLQFNMSIC